MVSHLQRGKTAADLVPRVGNNDELIDLLRAAAAEGKGGAGGSAYGGAFSPGSPPPAPRTPASPPPRAAATPRSALSTGTRSGSAR